ncbi:hypothetical protein [Emcibacter sp. SYSU 3D8]|uniref:hypothetical protein n=1 Tax=Emcibacter sp. SYSU 3D8 TaxID=3133969 RepID=UPI0031FE58F5
MNPFDLFVGADWSGARGPGLKGLQVAMCAPGQAAPSLVGNPAGGPWTRPAFARWLLDRSAAHRVLCSLDFSFGFPWEDRQAYFPGFADDPADHAGLWALVEAHCGAAGSLFGGDFAGAGPFQRHFRRGGVTGDRYVRRLRTVETLIHARGLGAAESVFNLVGAGQVGLASLSGMRMLRWLKHCPGVAVWPFDDSAGARLVLAETFPTAFVRMADCGRGKVRCAGRLNRVLDHFGSGPFPGGNNDTFALSDDMTDALILAAGLRRLSGAASLWNPAGLSDRVRRFEGWTFGLE